MCISERTLNTAFVYMYRQAKIYFKVDSAILLLDQLFVVKKVGVVGKTRGPGIDPFWDASN